MLLLAILQFSPVISLFSQLIISNDALAMPDVEQPSAGNAVTDPVFGTQIQRLTDARTAGNLGTVPHYSKRQAWNANDSLLLLYNADDGYFGLYDGSCDVQRIAHHHSRRYSPQTPDGDQSVYWAEPHATVNRAGTKVIWGSNWRKNMDDVRSVDVYLCDISEYVGINDEDGSGRNNDIFIYPNPVKDNISVCLELEGNVEVRIIITDLTGRIMKIESEYGRTGYNQFNINVNDLPAGMYSVMVQAGYINLNERFIKSLNIEH